jgi:histidine triad (HIT) family protein
MNREGAETYLRRLAEAELRRATTAPGDGGLLEECHSARLEFVALALHAAHAFDMGAANEIQAGLDLALGLRQPRQGPGGLTPNARAQLARLTDVPRGPPVAAGRAAAGPRHPAGRPGRHRALRRGPGQAAPHLEREPPVGRPGCEIMTGVSNIVLPSGGSCPFCAFLAGEKPYTILRRSEFVAILITREQRGVSHLLVVPVRHCPTILDLRDEESGALMREIRHAARIVDAADKRPGIAIWQNNGIAANQAVAHVHFHVAGTLEAGGTEWGEVPRLSVAETDAMAERLRQAEASLPDS